MPDVYRSAAFLCPSCEGTPLREYGTRLVCDTCDGILLTLEEFAGQVSDGRQVRAVDEGRASKACPRCQQPMRGCYLVVGERQLDQSLLRCERDGIWFGDGALSEVYEAIGSGSRGGPGRGDGGFGPMYGGPSGRRTFVRRPKRPAPREPSSPVPPSALRDRDLRCPDPACKRFPLRFEVSRWCCDDCDGLFVESPALEALIGEMAGAPWELPPPAGRPGVRRCPACEIPLLVQEIEGVTIDRCAEHGVWFDPAELEAVLQHAAGVETSGGLGSWLHRLFWRA